MLKHLKLTLFSALVVASYSSARADTLYEDLGGKSGITRLVTQTMVVVEADPRVADTFAETNLVRFKRLLEEHLCALTGGDCHYSGRSMAEAHKGLNLKTFQFNALAEDMQTAMGQLHIAFSTQNRLVAMLAPMHRDIVAR